MYLESNCIICCWACANCELAVFSSSSRFADSTHLIEYFSDNESISFFISSISALKFNSKISVFSAPNTDLMTVDGLLVFFVQSSDVVIGLDLFQKFRFKFGHFFLHFSLVCFSHRVQRYNEKTLNIILFLLSVIARPLVIIVLTSLTGQCCVRFFGERLFFFQF